jgi:hypothetical protein
MQAAEVALVRGRITKRITQLEEVMKETIHMLECEQRMLENAEPAWKKAMEDYEKMSLQNKIDTSKWLASKEKELQTLQANIARRRQNILNFSEEIFGLQKRLHSVPLCTTCTYSVGR